MADKSTRNLYPAQRSVAVGQNAGWVVIFGPATADGGVLQDPFELDDFNNQPFVIESGNTPLSWSVKNGGRVFTGLEEGTTLEIAALFTVDGANATVQLWGFDHFDESRCGASGVSATDWAPTLGKGEAQNLIGLAYPMNRDLESQPQLYTFTAPAGGETSTINISGSTPFPDYYNGDQYVWAPKLSVSCAGFLGVFPWVNTISSGSLLLLARVR